MRVTDLPRPVLEGVAARLTDDPPAGTEIFLVDRQPGPEAWRVAVHKVVERRNAEEGVVLALFPPDVQLAAGDSVDVSTFREIPVAGLLAAVERDLEGRVAEPLRLRARQVIDYLRLKGAGDTADRLAYLAVLAAQEEHDPAVAGGALFALGLVPDFDLFEKPDEFHHRLGQRNQKATEHLLDESATPLERVLRLRLEPETGSAFRARLLALFDGHSPSDVRAWGERIATDPTWRDLSLDRWPLEGTEPPEQLRIDVAPLKVAQRDDDGLYLLGTNDRVRIAWRTSPPPIDVPRLAYFRIEIVDADRVVAWESPLYKSGGAKGADRSRNLTHSKHFPSVDPGVYFFRVIGLDEAGDPFPQPPLRDPDGPDDGRRTNETDNILFDDDGGDGPVTEAARTTVADYAEAEFRARAVAGDQEKDPASIRPQQIEWTTALDTRGEGAAASIRYDLQRTYTVRLSRRLRLIERSILTNPDDGGHRRLSSVDPHAESEIIPITLPTAFAEARQAVFGRINEAGVEGGAVVALVDLCAIAGEIEAYATAYRAWIEDGAAEALKLDVSLVRLPDYGDVALLAPTHPLRLLWLLQQQQLARSWLREATARGEPASRLLGVWQRSFAARGLPSMLALGPDETFLDSGPLVGGWGAYLPPRVRDSRAVQAVLRARFGALAAYKTEADAPPSTLADKQEAFARQHAYTSALTINVVNPGDAHLVVDALIELEKRRKDDSPPLRYVVRLFTDSPHREGVGDAFRELSDPERQISEEADRLMSPGPSLLFPKLSWARNRLSDVRLRPERFPAHLTILLDAFPVAVRVKPVDPEDRGSFVHGLIQDVPRRFVGTGQAYTWVRRPAPRSGPDLPEAPGRSGLIASLLAGIGSLQAQVLAPNAETDGLTAVVMLNLETEGRSLLQSAHAASTWVLTLDPHLGLDYFDAAGRDDRPGYLLDFTPEFLANGGRQLLLTTRIDDEVAELMAPGATQLDLDPAGPGPRMLLEALRSLSGRLALRLISAPSQVQGALGMALARLFLEAYDLLAGAMIVPLDAHPELAAQADDPSEPQMRGDLLVVSTDPVRRHLDLLLVEAKNYGREGALGADLRQRIREQLQSSEQALRQQFDPTWTDPDRIDRAVQSWRLGQVLTFYLERAVRYGLTHADTAAPLRRFLLDLEAGYSLSVRKTGLVFRLAAASTTRDTEDPELPIWVVGGDHVGRIVREALRRFADIDAPQQVDAPMSAPSPTMRDDETWQDVRAAFTGPARARNGLARDVRSETTDDREAGSAPKPSLEQEVDRGQSEVVEEPATSNADLGSRISPEPAPAPRAPDTTVEAAVLLGESKPTPQYGLLGEVATEPWKRVALDLNGCNTIAVFGVQGSGKSYTVGSILEMAMSPLPGLNQLPQPVGAVVFHYHQTQDYPPEFVSMAQPNDDPDQVAALARWGAAPTGLDDLLILTTADTIAQRQAEFPGVAVEPIAFSSAELTVADWRFLMGATGNDALYLKLLNEVMRKRRGALTLAAILDGLADAPLADGQRALAETRLNFAARFIDDGRSLRSLLRPGRLVVVDLRDEFVEKEQALGLFVTMLNVFSGAGLGSEPFNKLIVFDEAHKYMGGAVIGHVVEVIREMRHKGVSVVIASQDPINVPPAVIELSSVVALHRFNSPNWLRHIQKSLAALGDLTPPMLAALGPGEAFVWSNKATDPTFTRRAGKLRMRPRATKHGGSTRTAV